MCCGIRDADPQGSPGVRATPFPQLLAKPLFGIYWLLGAGATAGAVSGQVPALREWTFYQESDNGPQVGVSLVPLETGEQHTVGWETRGQVGHTVTGQRENLPQPVSQSWTTFQLLLHRPQDCLGEGTGQHRACELPAFPWHSEEQGLPHTAPRVQLMPGHIQDDADGW